MSTHWELPARLVLDVIVPGSILLRIHDPAQDPVFFGPPAGTGAQFRFHDQHLEYQVCFLGVTTEAAFAETFLRDPPVRIVALRDLERRNLAILEVLRPLQVVALYGAGFAKLGLTADVVCGDYPRTQALSRAIWEYVPPADGIRYPSRHDDEQHCVALFDRAKDAIQVLSSKKLTANPIALASILDRYGIALV